MRIRSVLRLFSIFLLAVLVGSAAPALIIKLERPMDYRQKRYTTFDSANTTVLFLVAALDALGEDEPENQTLIRQAIQTGDFVHHTGYTYLYPPLKFGELEFYQIPLYEIGITWLGSILAALEKIDDPGHKMAMERIRKRIEKLKNDPNAEDKPGKFKSLGKAKRILEDEQVENDSTERELEPAKKRFAPVDEMLVDETLPWLDEEIAEPENVGFRDWLVATMPDSLH